MTVGLHAPVPRQEDSRLDGRVSEEQAVGPFSFRLVRALELAEVRPTSLIAPPRVGHPPQQAGVRPFRSPLCEIPIYDAGHAALVTRPWPKQVISVRARTVSRSRLNVRRGCLGDAGCVCLPAPRIRCARTEKHESSEHRAQQTDRAPFHPSMVTDWLQSTSYRG